MTQYHLNEATFDLPDALKDHSIHQFMLNDKGSNEFTFVISRADDIPEESIDAFGERLERELRKALPKFVLKEKHSRTIDTCPALELSYTWRNGDTGMHQRQTVILVEGRSTQEYTALMFTGTCVDGFNDKWNGEYDAMLSSVRLRSSSAVPVLDDVIAPASETAVDRAAEPADEVPRIFALAKRERILHVHADEEEACRLTNPVDVEDGLWSFYDHRGLALKPVFINPNTGEVWRTGGKFRLRPDPGGPPLQSLMDQVQKVKGLRPFDTPAHIQAYLERAAKAPHAGQALLKAASTEC